jgi:MoaA/NifB/PqqE/SkfB family radical SAM enzyme
VLNPKNNALLAFRLRKRGLKAAGRRKARPTSTANSVPRTKRNANNHQHPTRSEVPMPNEIQLNVMNIAKMRALPPTEYSIIRFDPNNNCNVHCVYCHNPRSEELIDLDEFQAFLTENVISTEMFQFGCVMEPTLDKRLTDFMLAVARSHAKAKHMVVLQTNGILLHRHDPDKLLEAGLTLLSVSVDSATVDTHKDLRGGTSLPKVQNNIIAFHKACPKVRIVFLTTVTSGNIDEADDLVAWGLDEGVKEFTFRQMFYRPTSNIVDHSRMPGLLVTAEEFGAMRDRVKAKFGTRARLEFLENKVLLERGNVLAANSLRA